MLEVFAREQRELSNSELARFLKMPESSCSDLVHTLLESGYLMRTLNSRRLYPTGRLLSVGQRIAANDPILAAAQEACDRLRDSTSETALCGRLEQGFVRILAASEGLHQLRYTANPGEKLAVHVSAMGKMILSLGTPEDAVRQLQLKPLRQLAGATVTDVDGLMKQIAKAGKQGWCLVENEGGDDLAALSVPVQLSNTRVAISVTGPVGRLRTNREAYLAALREIQQALSPTVPAAEPARAPRR